MFISLSLRLMHAFLSLSIEPSSQHAQIHMSIIFV